MSARKIFDRAGRGTQNEAMPAPSEIELTLLLKAWSAGDPTALERLVPHVQRELHRLASLYMVGERVDHPLQPTALINEVYIRLIEWKNVQWKNRAHFFAVSAQMMRRVLVDAARARQSDKRDNTVETTLNEHHVFRREKSSDLVALDDALTRLAELDPRKSKVVELRFFGGLGLKETAAVLELSDRT